MSEQKDVGVKEEKIKEGQPSADVPEDNSDDEKNISELENDSVETEPLVEENNKDRDGSESASQKTTKSWNNINIGIKKQKTSIKSKESKGKTENSEEDFFGKLAESFVKQQDQVINHRNRLLKWFAWITASQLVIINVLIFICILGNEQIISTTLSFMKFFVGATFLELLGGLLIIVKYVFSHETFDMLKHLTYVEPSSKK